MSDAYEDLVRLAVGVQSKGKVFFDATEAVEAVKKEYLVFRKSDLPVVRELSEKENAANRGYTHAIDDIDDTYPPSFVDLSNDITDKMYAELMWFGLKNFAIAEKHREVTLQRQRGPLDELMLEIMKAAPLEKDGAEHLAQRLLEKYSRIEDSDG